MDKLLILLLLVVLNTYPVFAQNESGQNDNNIVPTRSQSVTDDNSNSPTQADQNNESLLMENDLNGENDSAQNQNQNQTQNQGEDTQLQNQFQETEQEQLMNGESDEIPLLIQTQTRAAKQVMTELNQSETLESSQAGIQVRSLVQTQLQSQVNQQTELQKVQARSQVTKFFLGPDFKAINSLRVEIDQNQQRIRELNRVQTQLENEQDQELVAEMVLSLTQETQELQEQLDAEDQGFSLLGWLFRLFV